MSDEPESLILKLLRDMRAEMADMRGDIAGMRGAMATRGDLGLLREKLKADIGSLRGDVASDLHTTRKELGEQIVGLRRAVVEYHTSVIGHGIIISDLEARLRRVRAASRLAAARRALSFAEPSRGGTPEARCGTTE